MIKHITYFCFYFSALQLIGQEREVELLSLPENIKLVSLLEERIDDPKKAKGLIHLVYIERNKRKTNYYLDYLWARNQVLKNYPSYYFFLSNGLPVVVYTGFESSINFSDSYKKDIETIADEFLPPDELVITVHSVTWSLEVKNAKYKVRKNSKKDQLKIPDWIHLPDSKE